MSKRERKAGHELGEKVRQIVESTGIPAISCTPIGQINFT